MDNLLGIPWWIPAAIAAALYLSIRWGIPAIPAANPVFKILDGILKPFGILTIAVCGVIAAYLYYQQRIRSANTVRLPEPHLSTPALSGIPKNSQPETVAQASGDSIVDSGRSLPSRKTPEWSVELLRQVERKGFEQLVAAYFREESFRTETTPIGDDEGVDIKLITMRA